MSEWMLTNEERENLWHDWEESNIEYPGADSSWEDALIKAEAKKLVSELDKQSILTPYYIWDEANHAVVQTDEPNWVSFPWDFWQTLHRELGLK